MICEKILDHAQVLTTHFVLFVVNLYIVFYYIVPPSFRIIQIFYINSINYLIKSFSFLVIDKQFFMHKSLSRHLSFVSYLFVGIVHFVIGYFCEKNAP